MGSIGNLTISSSASNVNLVNNGRIGSTQVETSGDGTTSILNGKFGKMDSTTLNTSNGGTAVVKNNGAMKDTSLTTTDGGNSYVFNQSFMDKLNADTDSYKWDSSSGSYCYDANTSTNIFNGRGGRINDLDTYTKHQSETFINNRGGISSAYLDDYLDKTTMVNSGRVGDLTLHSDLGGEFNVNNRFGHIGSATIDVDGSSSVNFIS